MSRDRRRAPSAEEWDGPERRHRLRSGLRRHGLVRRPQAIRSLVERKALRFRDGNRIALFDNGRDGLAAMLEAIASARERIHLETYILRGDVTGRRFFEALTERASAGVEVRLLYDAFGSLSLDRQHLAPLVREGAKVVPFNPLRRSLVSRTLRRRDHRKILVVDGRTAFVGGLNIGDEYAAEIDGVPTWRDAHARIDGPSVVDVEAVFLESWFRANGPELPWSELLREPLPPSADPDTPAHARCAVLADGPVYSRRAMREVVASAVDEARERVFLASPYFTPGRRILDGLRNAADRGVDVEVVTAGRTDHPLLRSATHALAPRLIAGGVRLYEDRERMMHAKLATFDADLAIVGTSNLDRQSFEHSYEVNLVVEDPTVVEWTLRHFGSSTPWVDPIDEASIARRGPFGRGVDRLAGFVARLL